MAIQAGSRVVTLKGVAKGQSWMDKWISFHPQFPVSGDYQIHKVFNTPRWQPFGRMGMVETEEGVFDITGFLNKNADLSSFEAFLSDWQKKIEPDIYPLVHNALYGVDYYNAERRTARLRSAYDLLKDPAFRQRAADFLSEFREVKQDLDRKYPGLKLDPRFASSPFGDSASEILHIHGFECNCPAKKEGKSEPVFTVINLKAATEKYSGTRLKYFLAEQMLYNRFLDKMAQVDSLLVRLFRVGTSAYLASHLKYSEDEADYLLLSAEEVKDIQDNLITWKKDLLKQIRRQEKNGLQKYFELKPRPGTLLGYLFARKLSERFLPEQLVDFSMPAIVQELIAYLTGPEGARQSVSKQ